MIPKPYLVKAVLFDFDGTLTRPGAIDFAAIRSAIGCPGDRTILEYIRELPDPTQRTEAMEILNRMEMEAAGLSQPNDGAEAAIDHLKALGLPIGILTRNSREAVVFALKQFDRAGINDFDIILTRNDPIAPKPSPEGVFQAAGRFGVDPSEILVVGDFRLDIETGRNAGALTAELLKPGGSPATDSDFVLKTLADLPAVVRGGVPLPPGKFPNDLLNEFFGHLTGTDPSILIQPGVGEDAAAVDLSLEDTIILTSDPITFVSDDIATYAVLVNANDIATTGARPRWLLTTLLFPPGTTPSAIRFLMHDIRKACDRYNITLCGGHTEITDAVNRPLVTGMMVGTVRRKALVDKRQMQTGDTILLTKGVAVEGTAIIANAFSDRLLALGMDEGDIRECQAFVDNLSVLREAQLATEIGGVTAMHDVTEGGLATALAELSAAGGHRFQIRLDRIPIYPQTERICRLLGINPLGLIGSGSLIICCRPEAGGRLLANLRKNDIAASMIGEVMASGAGVEARDRDRPRPWPEFEADEITRLFLDEPGHVCSE